MPTNDELTVLRRWIDMDARLARVDFAVARHAEKWGVTEKTVRRDLEAFKKLGLVIRRSKHAGDRRCVYWWYPSSQPPLFQCNVVRSEGRSGGSAPPTPADPPPPEAR